MGLMSTVVHRSVFNLEYALSLIYLQQGKSEGFDSSNRPSNQGVWK